MAVPGTGEDSDGRLLSSAAEAMLGVFFRVIEVDLS